MTSADTDMLGQEMTQFFFRGSPGLSNDKIMAKGARYRLTRGTLVDEDWKAGIARGGLTTIKTGDEFIFLKATENMYGRFALVETLSGSRAYVTLARVDVEKVSSEL